MNKIIIICLLLCAGIESFTQPVRVTYKEGNEDIVNPERGFYIPKGTKASNFILLDEKQLATYRSELQQLNGASYKVKVSLIYRGYELDTFKSRALSPAFLQNLQKDFDAVRKAGLKMILRFAYTNASHGGDCSDEYKICPPYGDAPLHIILHQVRQLKPLLQKNADIIAVLQQGFIGIWGENYYTDYFDCASGNAVISDSGWQLRNQFLKALLEAMPADRMVQVRTPQIKQRFVYGPRALVTVSPLLVNEAFTNNDKARIGFHNDCFLASEDDYGTFYNYGNSVTAKDTANKVLRAYFAADSRYTAIGGETCDDAFSPQNDCAPMGNAEMEMAVMHYSYLNAAYNNQVNNDWDSLDCIKRIKQQLGYRMVLQTALLPKTVKSNKNFSVELHLENKGYASPFNPRPVQLILRNQQTGKITQLYFKTSIQRWFTGKIVLKQNFVLPVDISPGSYQLLFNLPDGYTNLQSNPAYSIRLANTDLWEATTGFNNLNHLLTVE
jgi:hypothetical protein